MSDDQLRLSYHGGPLKGSVHPGGSKSISNRLLIMKYLSGSDVHFDNISHSDDTQVLIKLLESDDDILDCRHAGTTLRFITAYTALKGEYKIVTGSERMQNRPIGLLVDAMNELGADIRYLDKEGFPPIAVYPSVAKWKNEVNIKADTSSQFISALLLIAPYLENGLTIHLKGTVVSDSYIDMTIGLMLRADIELERKGNSISVKPGKYDVSGMEVESDWSSASYFYGLAALVPGSEIFIKGLQADSLQGDSVIASWLKPLGVDSIFTDEGVMIRSVEVDLPGKPTIDFISSPDLFQTVSVVFAGLGITAHYSGLNTLRLKETDRLHALEVELNKVGIKIMPDDESQLINSENINYLQEGKVHINNTAFETWNDHRMAMSLSMLCAKANIQIMDPGVVNKSYPQFWNDLRNIGIIIS